MKYPHTLNYAAAAAAVLTFVAVPNTRMDQLVPSFGPQYKERGFSGTAAIFDAWIGCALRDDDLIFLHPGGHNDTNFNGDFAYNATSKKWRMLHLPSDFTDPVWAESVALYGGSRANVNISERYDPHGDLVWKDGRPCSTHCYGLVVDAEEFGVFHLRNGVWRYDPTTQEKTKLPGVGSFQAPSDAYAFYLSSTKKIYVGIDNTPANLYGQIYEVDPTSGAWTLITASGEWYESECCQMEDGRVFRFMRSNNTSVVIDFSARTVTPTPTLSDLFAADPLIALMFSNETGLLALRGSGNLSSVNMTTGQVTHVGPSGIPASLLQGPVRINHTLGRLKRVANGSAKKFIFPIATSVDVYEMVIA